MDLKKELTQYTEKKLKEFFENTIDELSIYKALNIYDSLTKQFNNMFELIEDWYSLQNYKKYKEINDNYKFIKYLVETDLESLKKDTWISKNLNEEDLKMLKALAEEAKNIYSLKSKIENLITKKSEKLFPNLTNILGPILAVRMLSFTKSLDDFAKLPSSTIQLIGAENALFRHLKYNKKPPKYGLLYQHPLLKPLNNHNKGKLARFMANKIALAARLDINKKISPKLKEEIIKKAESLK